LQALITEAQTLYADTTQGAAIFLAAITEAQSFLTSESSADVTKAKTTLSQAITAFKLLNASSSQPVDLTARLNNPGFDDNNATGWSGAGTVGYHSVEFYQKTFNMYQTLAGLPAGKYRLQVRGFERPKNNDGEPPIVPVRKPSMPHFTPKPVVFRNATPPFHPFINIVSPVLVK
jgi:hypothetical protein